MRDSNGIEAVVLDREISLADFEMRKAILLRPRGVHDVEFTASEIRRILQSLFPQRRLVLSQFTFFSQVGVARATGTTFRRGRRCYRLQDILSIACVLALKEEGIPYKNLEALPVLIQNNAARIFKVGPGCRLSGYRDVITLTIPGEPCPKTALTSFLEDEMELRLFWGFDVGILAQQIEEIAEALAGDESSCRAA